MLKTLYILLVCYMPILDKYMPATNFGHGIPDIDFMRLTSYLLIIVFLFESAVIKQTRIYSKWIGFLSIFSLVVLSSVSWSNYSYTFTVINAISDNVVLPLIIAIIALNLFAKSEDNINAYIKNIIICSFILSLISMYQMLSSGALGGLSSGSIATLPDEGRSAGTFGNPNVLAIFLVLTIPCVIYAIEKQMMPRIFGWVLSACLAGGIICTVSRKGMATGVLAFGLYYFLKRKYKKVVAVGIVVAIMTVFISGYAIISGRFSIDRLNSVFTGKKYMTYAGLQMYKTSPLIGLGYNGYYDNFGRYFPWSIRNKYDAHNIFITALANYGAIGFIPFLGIFLYPLYYSKKIVRQSRILNNTGNLCDMAIICISSVIPFMISGWFAGGLFYSFSVIIVLYTNIALVFAVGQHSSNGEETE